MNQRKYIIDLLHRTNMAEAHTISSPMASSYKLQKKKKIIYFKTLHPIDLQLVLCSMLLLPDLKLVL